MRLVCILMDSFEETFQEKFCLDKDEITLARPIHTDNKNPVLTNLLDVFKNENSDEVHRFLLTHRVNGSPEGVQRTHTQCHL
jgi:hypothetical protein